MCVARKLELEEYIEVLSFSLCVETAAVGPVVNTMSALSQKNYPIIMELSILELVF